MEPGSVAAAAYGAETAVEGAVGAALVTGKPTIPLRGNPWRRIPTDEFLPRSSHSLSIVKGQMYIFGGEEKPHQIVDNAVHVYTLPQSGSDETDYQAIAATSFDGANGPVPEPRSGHTAAVIDDRIYVFGGQGKADLKPLEEHGRVWVFDSRMNHWSFLDPQKGTPFPEPRYFHASTSTVHPRCAPSGSNEDERDNSASAFDDHGTVFIHGGCSGSGRCADVWGFDVAARTWSRYADAPGPARSGPGLCFVQDRLHRFGGFDGQKELGGLQFLHFLTATYNDKGGKGEMEVAPLTGQWETVDSPDGAHVPGDRSVAGLHPVTTGQGRYYLLLLLGERLPGSAADKDAGKFWDDVWSFQLKPEGMTAASFKDATRWLFGAKTSEGTWARVDIPESSKTEGTLDHPGPRGWFASSQGQDLDPASVVLWGGVREDNQRAGDGWVLRLDI